MCEQISEALPLGRTLDFTMCLRWDDSAEAALFELAREFGADAVLCCCTDFLNLSGCDDVSTGGAGCACVCVEIDFDALGAALRTDA